jgi:predicted metal-binding membrane protein
MTSTRRSTLTLWAATLGLAAGCWALALHLMSGMDMGAGSDVGSFGTFLATWAAMMAAMMLPGALPALTRASRAAAGELAAARFAGVYLAIWFAAGLAVYAVDRPHGAAVAGGLTLAAGLYELTPLKRSCRRRCREESRSGLRFGVQCVGSTAGLMLTLVALDVMSVTWMIVVAVLVAAQKLWPPRPAIDIPIGLAIAALGVLILLDPSLLGHVV